MTEVPYRTGLTSVRKLLHKVCQLLVTYDTVIKHVLPTDQHIYVDAVSQACSDFLENTDNPRP